MHPALTERLREVDKAVNIQPLLGIFEVWKGQ